MNFPSECNDWTPKSQHYIDICKIDYVEITSESVITKSYTQTWNDSSAIQVVPVVAQSV